MQTEFCKQLGIEAPIFAFTHCRDVVVAVSKAGGIGVLGAVGFNAGQLKEELDWIDEHIGDHIYGVDVAIPQRYEGMEETDPEELVKMLEDAIPDQHRKFVEKLLTDHGVPEYPDNDGEVSLSFSALQAQVLVDEALTRPKCRMIVNALGTPPAEIVTQVHDAGRLIGALAGRLKHGINHQKAGLDFVVCQGSEGAATPAKSLQWCCGHRWWMRWHPCRYWRRVASAHQVGHEGREGVFQPAGRTNRRMTG